MSESQVFDGFELPQENYAKVPHAIFNAFPIFTSMSEVLIVLYILRHTWGYQEFDEGKRITTDEFMHGRKRRDGSRIDNGTGMTAPAIRSGIERALEHGFIEVEIDNSDQARIKKFYTLHMKQMERNFLSDGKKFSIGDKESFHRSEKDTEERNRENPRAAHSSFEWRDDGTLIY